MTRQAKAARPSRAFHPQHLQCSSPQHFKCFSDPERPESCLAYYSPISGVASESEPRRLPADDDRGDDLGDVLARLEWQRADAVEVPEVALLDRILDALDRALHARRSRVVRRQRQHHRTAGTEL